MIRQRYFALIVFFIFTGLNCMAVETEDGYVRLFIDEKNGNFSLYYLTDSSATHEPLFNHRNSTTSFLTVNVNGKTYQLGKSKIFNTRIGKINGNPAVIYESPFLLVSKVFYPVKTISSPVANGVKVIINIENKSGKEAAVGLRVLIDTHLGETRGNIPFVTDNLTITGETLVKASSGERYWITRGAQLSLMGNIINPSDDDSKEPDFLHFANWRKINNAPWKAAYREGQSFSSTGDSAVCYYYEPETLAAGESFKYAIFLTTEDTAWYNRRQTVTETPINTAAAEEAAKKYGDSGILTLIRLRDMTEQFIAGKILLNEQDLLEIEKTMERLRDRF